MRATTQSSQEPEHHSSKWESTWRKAAIAVTGLFIAPVTVALATDYLKDRASSHESGPPMYARLLLIERHNQNGDDWVFPSGRSFTREERLSFVEALDRGDDEFMRSSGAVDGSVIRPIIILEGRRRNGVTVTGMHLDPRCTAPLTGTLIHRGIGGGPMDNPRLMFDLDESKPKAYSMSVGDTYREYFSGHSISLREHEQVTITLEAKTVSRFCTFDIYVAVSDGRRTEQVKVDTGSSRFAVTAYAGGATSPNEIRQFNRYHRVYLYSDGDLTEVNPRRLTEKGW